VVDDWLEDLWTALEVLLKPGCVPMALKTTENGELTLPTCPPASLGLEYLEGDKIFPIDLVDSMQLYPLLNGFPVKANITKAKFLTKPGAVKTAIEITVQFQSVTRLKFETF